VGTDERRHFVVGTALAPALAPALDPAMAIDHRSPPMSPSGLPGWARWSGDEWCREMDLPLLELHHSLTSTNDRLRTLAEAGAPFFATVVADVQTRGRGRGGKRWHSEGGAGLWISVLLPPPPAGPPGATTLAVGVAAAEAVEEAGGVACRLKWPNDLVLEVDGGSGGKVGGILCERVGDVDGIVAGVGINLRPLEVPLAGSVSLEEASGVAVLAHRLAALLLERLRVWADPPPDRVTPELRRAWEARDALAGRQVEADQGVRGYAAGLAPDGGLQVRSGSGSTQTVRGGSVRLLEDHGAHGNEGHPEFGRKPEGEP
jgi:BirA family transcriptional regulator, biotin operon repressor / biotin---[acetyl-CoA-carboxylase] ligase